MEKTAAMRTGNVLSAIVCFVFLLSCRDEKIPPPPAEPCKNISMADLPVITHGFYPGKYDSVLIQCYAKNSAFDSLLVQRSVALSPVNDQERMERDFTIPEDFTSAYDMKFVFADSLVYRLTEMEPGWIPRWCNSFCGYECTLLSFKINDSLNADAGNIYLQEPSFRYPWEK